MLSDLLKKLENEHGIAPSQGQNILNTIAQHIKENFPMVGGMLDKVFGNQAGTSTDPAGTSTDPTSALTNSTGIQNDSGNESTLQKLEELAKSKLGGIF